MSIQKNNLSINEDAGPIQGLPNNSPGLTPPTPVPAKIMPGEVSNKVEDIENQEFYSIADNKIKNNFFPQISALINKRFTLYKRNIKGLIFELIVPVLIVTMGLGMSKIQFFKNNPVREYSIEEFPTPQELKINSEVFVSVKGVSATPQDLFSKFENKDLFDEEFVELKANKNETERLIEFDNNIFDAAAVKPKDYTYGAYLVYKLDTKKHQY